jgi:hypothetical protein
MEKSYNKKTNCGNLKLNLCYDSKKRRLLIDANMDSLKCSASKYINNSLMYAADDIYLSTKQLEEHKCKKGEKSGNCSAIIGKCIEDFFKKMPRANVSRVCYSGL